MSRFLATSVMDASLNKVATATIMTVCEGQPANRTEAVTNKGGTNKKLADVALIPADLVVGPGDNGLNTRKVTIAQKSGVLVDETGQANHVALSDALELLLVTTCNPVTLTKNNHVTFPSFKYEVAAVQ